jgi:hypothetical protein
MGLDWVLRANDVIDALAAHEQAQAEARAAERSTW